MGSAFLFCCALFTVHGSLDFQFHLFVGVALAGALAVELKAPRHRLYGFSPTTFPLYLYLALMPGGSAGLAVGAALVFIALRAVFGKRERGVTTAWEYLVDALSVSIGLAALKVLRDTGPEWAERSVVGVLGASFLYFLFRPILQNMWLDQLEEKERKVWTADQVSATTLMSVAAFLAVPYGFLSSVAPELSFLLPIAPLLLETAIAPTLDPTKDPTKIRLVREAQEAADQSPRSADTPSRSAVTALDLRQGGFGYLQSLADSLDHRGTVDGVVEEVLRSAIRLVQVDSYLLYLSEDGKHRLADSRTPFDEQLAEAEAEGRVEPVVDRVLRSHKIDFLRADDNEEGRVFVEEQTAAAIPLGSQGVLYLGRRESTPFSDEEIANLAVLGQQANLALQLARLKETREESLSREAEALERLGLLLSSQNGLLRVIRELSGVDNVEALLDKAGARLNQLVSHDYFAVFAGLPGGWPPEHQLMGPPGKPKTDDQALLQVAEEVMQKGVPLLENDLKASSLPQPSSGTRSLVCCPLPADGEALGAVVICSAASEAFQEAERDLLTTFCYCLGYQLWSLREEAPSMESGAAEDLKRTKEYLVQCSKLAAIGQLAAGVAHELNTPLGSLLLAVEGALKTLERAPERSEKRLNRALQAGGQMKSIIEKLLFYSREGAIEERETDLSKVIDDTVSLLEHQFSLDDIGLEKRLGSDELVLANQNEIQQILINLLANAKDAVMALGEGHNRKIVITTSDHPKAVELSVEDNGVGMNSETLAQIFEPFYTTKPPGKGTGLGLSVTKELVEKHGGAVKVQSTPGEGTRFLLRLPKLAK